MARVSVIIPTHNRSTLLPRAIESAHSAGPDVEVVIVDDASTDDTAEVCGSLRGVRYIRLEENVRQAAARNAGIAASDSEFVAFLDDDDLRLPGSFTAQLEALERNPDAGFVYGPVLFGDSQTCTPTGEVSHTECLTGDLFWSLTAGNKIYLPSVVARRRCLEEVGPFDPAVTGVEDWDMWMRLSQKFLTEAVDEPVAIYRLATRTSKQTSSDRLRMCFASATAQEHALNSPKAMTDTRKRKKVRQEFLDYMTEDLLGEVRAEYDNGKLRLASRYLWGAVRLNPKRALTLRTFKWLFDSPWKPKTQSTRSP